MSDFNTLHVIGKESELGLCGFFCTPFSEFTEVSSSVILFIL